MKLLKHLKLFTGIILIQNDAPPLPVLWYKGCWHSQRLLTLAGFNIRSTDITSLVISSPVKNIFTAADTDTKQMND